MKHQYTLGLITGFCLGCLYFMVPTLIEGFNSPNQTIVEKSKFEVVDNYNGCDVIRWSANGRLAEYKYFLVCK